MPFSHVRNDYRCWVVFLHHWKAQETWKHKEQRNYSFVWTPLCRYVVGKKVLICGYVENCEIKALQNLCNRTNIPPCTAAGNTWVDQGRIRINKSIIASPSRDVQSYLSSDRQFLGVMIRQLRRFLTILRQFGRCLIKIARYFCSGQPKRSATSEKSTPVGFKRSKVLRTGFGKKFNITFYVKTSLTSDKNCQTKYMPELRQL